MSGHGSGLGALRNATLCTHCGYCLPHCPTYRVDNNELLSPRGRVSVILALAAGEIAAEAASEALASCLTCRACHSACPAGVRPGKLVVVARGKSPQPAPAFILHLHRITDNHPLTAAASRLLGLYQRSGFKGLLDLSGVFRGSNLLGRIQGLLPERREGVRRLAGGGRTPAPARGRVALLGGCMGRLFFPDVGVSAANLIQSLGYRVATPEGFGCCGAPYREQGEREAFLRQAKRTIAAFGDLGRVEAVVCDSTVCAVTARSFAKALAKDPAMAGAAAAFSAKVLTLSQFLDRAGAWDQLALGDPGLGRLTFHHHCQARHGLGLVDPPERLLAGLASPFTPLPRGDRCCGAGGDYMLRYPRRSGLVRQDKLSAIRESRADTVVGENPGCLMNMEAGLRQAGSRVRVRHLAEVLWAARQRGAGRAAGG